MKKIGMIIAIVLAALLVLSFAKNIIAKTSVSAGVKAMTGLKLSMKSMNIGVFRTLIGIKELKLHNPPGFPDKLMVNMPEIYLDYDLGAFLKKKVHLEEIRLNLKEFTVVKNEKGELNLDSLKVVQAQKEGKKPQEQEKGKAPQMQIDSLELKIGKVIYKDYSRGRVPSVREFEINLNERYENISNPYTLVSLIVVKALMNTTIARLADIDLAGLQGTISDTLASAQKIATEAAVKAQEAVKETAEKTQEAAKQASQKAQEAAKETTEILKKTTEGLKDKIKLPFGSK